MERYEEDVRKETGRKERSNESRRGGRGEKTVGGGAEAGRKILRACALGDHTLTQRHSGGALSPINGWKKWRETPGQEDEN